MRRQLSADLCNGIIGMRQAGSSQKDIAHVLRITQWSISKILKRHRETGLTTPKSRYGRPKKTTARHDGYLLRLCRNSPTKPSSLLRADWIRLVNYWLLNADYLERRPVKKSRLQRRHQQARFGRMGTWTGVMVTGNTLCSVTNPDFCCIVKMVVFECSDKLTRLYSMSVYCLEYIQVPTESRSGVPSIAEGNPSSTYWMETWISTSTYVSQKPKCFHLLGETSSKIGCSKMSMVQHTKCDGSWISSKIMSPDLNPIENLWSEISRGLNNMDNRQQTWLNWPRLLWTSGEIFQIRSSQPSFSACLDACVPYTTPEEATRSIEYIFILLGIIHQL